MSGKNWWLKLGCFFTGQNYNIVLGSSEVAAMKVKQTVSALMIVCIIWGFVGYAFTDRYLKGGTIASLFGALLACLIVIQIERQIIMSINPSKLLVRMRILIACMMAIIGSVIIDQVIFKQDVEKRRISLIDSDVNKIYPVRSEQLRRQTQALDSTIALKEMQRILLTNDLDRNPMIKLYSNNVTPTTESVTVTDSSKNTSIKTKVVNARTTSVTSIPNPKMQMLKPLDIQIQSIRQEKIVKDNALLTLRTSIKEELESKVGFIDELNILMDLIFGSIAAIVVWVIWFIILLGLEMFILAGKIGETTNVYDETLKHQERLLKRKLELLFESTKG